ncbi:MAG: hypothetical protein ABWY93_18765 [Mycobacterium sp.]
MSPEEALGIAREWYDVDLYGSDDAMLFALLVDVAAACERAIAMRDNPMLRDAGATVTLANLATPRENMLTDLEDNLELREGDRR